MFEEKPKPKPQKVVCERCGRLIRKRWVILGPSLGMTNFIGPTCKTRYIGDGTYTEEQFADASKWKEGTKEQIGHD